MLLLTMMVPLLANLPLPATTISSAHRLASRLASPRLAHRSPRTLARRPRPSGARRLVIRPDPAPSSPVQVFVLAGQSNMLGYGLVEPTDSHGGDYTLEALVASGASAYQHLRDSAGEWTVRDDVDIEMYGAVRRTSGLTVGFGADERFFGPELQSGHVLGERLSQKVLLIKVAWGGKSLHGETQPLTL